MPRTHSCRLCSTNLHHQAKGNAEPPWSTSLSTLVYACRLNARHKRHIARSLTTIQSLWTIVPIDKLLCSCCAEAGDLVTHACQCNPTVQQFAGIYDLTPTNLITCELSQAFFQSAAYLPLLPSSAPANYCSVQTVISLLACSLFW